MPLLQDSRSRGGVPRGRLHGEFVRMKLNGTVLLQLSAYTQQIEQVRPQCRESLFLPTVSLSSRTVLSHLSRRRRLKVGGQ
jgi:hypothetical protein